MKQLFEFFPLIVFFVVYYKSDKDLYLSITAVIIATLISLVALYIKERKISTMMLVSTVILVVFGGLSIFLKNDIFLATVLGGLMGPIHPAWDLKHRFLTILEHFFLPILYARFTIKRPVKIVNGFVNGFRHPHILSALRWQTAL